MGFLGLLFPWGVSGLLRHPSAPVGCVLLSVFAAAVTTRAESGSPWLDRVNFFRAMAALPPVTENPALSGAVLEHVRYMVSQGEVTHAQKAGDPWATPAGAAAAAASNLAGSPNPFEPESWAVDMWMQAPFHALGILDPALRSVGFGIHRAPGGRLQTAAGLDVLRGRGTPPASLIYPVVWPANGWTVPIATHVAEYPSPLTSCGGYQAPTGLPLIVQLGSDERPSRVTASWFAEGTRKLDHCIFDGGSYENRDAPQQRLGRRILAAHNAIVVIPRRPLRPGARYRAVIEVNGRRIDWTFGVSQLVLTPPAG